MDIQWEFNGMTIESAICNRQYKKAPPRRERLFMINLCNN